MAWYILDDDNKPIASSTTEALEWMENNPDRITVKQEHINEIYVSTVFLGLNHSGWYDDIPILWETMIFEGEHDQYQERYTSYEDAVKGHQVALDLINQCPECHLVGAIHKLSCSTQKVTIFLNPMEKFFDQMEKIVMKNIHVLPTENSSKLYYNKDGVLELHRLQWRKNTQNIYITSDEEIKEVDWCAEFNLGGKITEVFKCKGMLSPESIIKKIILTTDQGLIKDGVQAIDDEFLEWFVKNPSCEEVEVEGHIYKGQDETEYKIIIPKEEPNTVFVTTEQAVKIFGAKKISKLMKKEIKPEQIWNEEKIKGVKKLIQKQKLIDIMGQDEELGLYDEPKIKCYCGHTSYCDCRPEQYFKDIEFPQQEIPKTLEEAAETFWLNDNTMADKDRMSYVNGFLTCALWHQERSYSEEEVLDIFHEYFCYQIDEDIEVKLSFNKWFNKFKKK
jgi:hypothetical protein